MNHDIDQTALPNLLLASLGLIHELVALLAPRYGLEGEESEELESLVRLRLIENDYRLLRQWHPQATLETYLTEVIERQCQGWADLRWGKWRKPV